MLSCVLVANRGEIAVRVIRTARRMGLRTIAVYSDADRDALHVRAADLAIRIGGPAAADSYLRGDRIIAAAKEAGADCIHPGYGFLSENAEFAEAVAAAGLTFIGPPPSAIRAMGLKDRAKALMAKAGVPAVPGYHGTEQEPGFLLERSREIGFPVLIKAVAGGGGKGMRRVDAEGEFAAALEGARREALSAFGNGDLLIETYVRNPRHIEMQVFADRHGNVLHLFERDCSLQRRHQKVIEEAPAPGLTPVMRDEMGRAATEAARAVGYVGAGTVEFIAEGGPKGLTGRFWFMEMNTRLQVEHPVTEAITGQDLVEWQFRVAAGEALPPQSDIGARGHAVEARVYAEDPETGFLPSTGRVHALRLPQGEGVRVDAGVAEGGEVSPYYDPMIAKVIAHAPTRGEALDRLGQALDDMRIAGPKTNLAFLMALCRAPEFRAGEFDTGFIGEHAAQLGIGAQEPDHEAIRLAALAMLTEERGAGSSPWAESDGFQLGHPRRQGLRVAMGDEEFEIEVIYPGPRVGFAGGETSASEVVAAVAEYRITRAGSAVFVLRNGRQTQVSAYDGAASAAHALNDHDGAIRAPMHGRLVRLAVAEGETVAAGQLVAIVEAMKMEHSLVAPRAGKVIEIAGSEGAQVAQGATIAVIRADGGE